MQDYLDTLSDFVCRTRVQDLDDALRRHGRWIIADSIPVIAAGMQGAEMRALVAAQLESAAPGKAWVIGTGRRTNPVDAALLNGTAGVWLELDEGNLVAKGHPGIQVVPAALAAAQEIGASGSDLLLAVILGYEVSARISRAAKVRIAVHPHGTYGVIGAAVAVGKMKGFTPAQMRQLINVAATMGLATSRNTLLEGSTVRNIYAGHSGLMGQMAVRLVLAGFKGESDGVQSIYGRVLSDEFDPGRVVGDLGRDWLLMQGYFKLHCTGRYVHSVIDALEDALAKAPAGFAANSVERIDVSAYALAASLNGQNITTSFGARFSVPFALATILRHGESNLTAFSEQAVADPQVQQLARRVFVVENEAYNALYPGLQRCDLKMTLRDGTVLTGRCDVTKGEASKPHSEEDLAAKFMTLARSVWSAEKASALRDVCLGLEAPGAFEAFSGSVDL
jgi:2-methylcitrate dehydratase PrpD